MGEPEIPREVTDALASKMLYHQREGGSIYDDGDPLGSRIVTVWMADNRAIRFHNLRVKACGPGEDFGSWNVTLHWDRMEAVDVSIVPDMGKERIQ